MNFSEEATPSFEKSVRSRKEKLHGGFIRIGNLMGDVGGRSGIHESSLIKENLSEDIVNETDSSPSRENDFESRNVKFYSNSKSSYVGQNGQQIE